MKNTLFFAVCLLFASNFAFSQNKTIILGRPTDKSVTASILFDQKVNLYLEYGTKTGVYPNTTATINNFANVPDEIDMSNLIADTKYYYRLRYRPAGNGTFLASPEYFFRTQRATGTTFRFTIEADEHLYDKKGVRNMYKITLANQAKDSADFMLSLGDIFGDDHTPDQTTSADMDALHKDYLQYLGAVCHSLPFYVCLGNHEGENGYYLKQNPPNNIAVYGTQWRKYYYPNPFPNNFYTGNTTMEPYGIGQPENYFAWTWGEALFVVLDVYRDCDVNDKPQNWDWTLGKTQYDWLKTTLETSKSKFKFVFAHHTRGQGRGGIKTARGYEWGGYEINKNIWEFDKYRPGWAKPIHQLFIDNGVNIFFQGHDHLFAHEIMDNVTYQEVPMAADSTYIIGMLANADAYTSDTLDGTGHLRVTVSPTSAKVDFIRAYLPQDTNGTHKNGEVAFSYTVTPKINSVETEQEIPPTVQLEQNYPNPFLSNTTIKYSIPSAGHVALKVFDVLGKEIATLVDEFQQAGTYNSNFTAEKIDDLSTKSNFSSSLFFYQLQINGEIISKKGIIIR